MHNYIQYLSVFMLLQHMYFSSVCHYDFVYKFHVCVGMCPFHSVLQNELFIVTQTCASQISLPPRNGSIMSYTNTKHIAIQLTEWDQTDIFRSALLCYTPLSPQPQIMFIVLADETHIDIWQSNQNECMV